MALGWVVAGPADGAGPPSRPSANRAVGVVAAEPVHSTAPPGSAAVFVGVNTFRDKSIRPLAYAVNDAIAQSHLFVLQLRLVPPKNCYLALDGDPVGDEAKGQVEALRAAGVHVTDALRSSILDALLSVHDIGAGPADLLLVSLSTHGFEDNGVPYALPSDGRVALLNATAVSTGDVDGYLRRSKAGKKVLLIDACRNDPQKAVPGDKAAPKGAPGGEAAAAGAFRQAFQKAEGQIVLASCDRGQFSFEDEQLKHGVFTYFVLEALGAAGVSGAAPDAQGFVTLGAVAQHVSKGVGQWVRENKHGPARQTAQQPWLNAVGEAQQIPLAFVRPSAAEEARALKARRLAAAKQLQAALKDVYQPVLDLLNADEAGLDDGAKRRLKSVFQLVDGGLTPADFLAEWKRFEFQVEVARLRREVDEAEGRRGGPTAQRKLKEFLLLIPGDAGAQARLNQYVIQDLITAAKKAADGGMLEAADRYLNEALRLDHNNAAVLQQLGLLKVRQETLALLRAAKNAKDLGQREKAIDLANQVLARDRDNVDAKVIVKDLATPPAASPDEAAGAVLAKANLHADRGEFPEAFREGNLCRVIKQSDLGLEKVQEEFILSALKTLGRSDLKADERLETAGRLARDAAALGAPAARVKAVRDEMFNLRMPKAWSSATGMEFVRIEPGTFVMGTPGLRDNQDTDGPGHRVTLTRPFYLGKYEVMRGQFAQFVKDQKYQTLAEAQGSSPEYDEKVKGHVLVTGRNWLAPGFEQSDDHPAVEISWIDATKFCEWLTAEEARRTTKRCTFRLPTEAEWEYACRGGNSADYSWGSANGGERPRCNGLDLTAHADPAFKALPTWFNWRDGYVFTAPVGRFDKNPFGLYDMHGNAWEWTSTYYQPDPAADETDPVPAPNGKGVRVYRGGGWGADANMNRSAYRRAATEKWRDKGTGFRVLREE